MEDDGRGIDYEKVRQGIVDSGAMSRWARLALAERELREFLFRPGFSTASSTSELAGRGVGLDVVRSNVHALNGEIDVRSELGRGACFTVKVPLTLIISQALFVRCGKSVLHCRWPRWRKFVGCAPSMSKMSAESCSPESATLSPK